jgi:hypothetical protein
MMRGMFYSLLVHLPAYIAEGDARFVAYDGAPGRALRNYVKDRYPGKSGRLVRCIEWVVTVSLLLIKSSRVTFRG